MKERARVRLSKLVEKIDAGEFRLDDFTAVSEVANKVTVLLTMRRTPKQPREAGTGPQRRPRRRNNETRELIFDDDA